MSIASAKALIVVLVFAAAVFLVFNPALAKFTARADLRRREALWVLLTAAAFLTPTFWWFLLIAAPAVIWGARRDPNPVAMYLLLLQVVPSVPVNIPGAGIHRFFSLDIYRILSLCVLAPYAWRLALSRAKPKLGWIDILVFAYGALQIFLYIRPDLPSMADTADSPTAALRRAFLFLVDGYLPFYAISRGCHNRRALTEALAALCTSCVLLAPIAVFEALRRWPLYNGIVAHWSAQPLVGQFLLRDGLLRARGSAGDPLSLGCLLAIGWGSWLYLKKYVTASSIRTIGTLALCAGLLATYSRGPWMGALLASVIFTVCATKAPSAILKSAAATAAVVFGILISPLGGTIINSLPFLGGTIGRGTLTYRQALARDALPLIASHPFFGDQFAYSKLAGLRQGQGIIDIVNTYLEVALFYGLFGLALFVWPMMHVAYKVWRISRLHLLKDPHFALLGASIFASIAGTALMLADSSFQLNYARMYYVLLGGALAYTTSALQYLPSRAQAVTIHTQRPPVPAGQRQFRAPWERRSLARHEDVVSNGRDRSTR